jgi:tRNA (guanine-N7-)-methyltransferase
LVTDWTSYLDQALGILTRDPAFAWTAERAADWRNPPADHVITRYQAKGLGDCAPVWLEFVRR